MDIATASGATPPARPTGKRKKDSKNTPPNREFKRLKALEILGLTFAQMVANNALVKVIVASGYLEARLTPMQLNRLGEEISKEIDALPGEGRAPRFDDTFITSGTIVLHAADICTRDWLVERTPLFRLKEGLNVDNLGTECLQRYHRTTVLIPGISEDSTVVLRILSFQNPTRRRVGF